MNPSNLETGEKLAPLQTQFIDEIKGTFHVEDARGVEMISLMGRILHMCRYVDCQEPENQELSLPRWRLLLHLYLNERIGRTGGLKPTQLSKTHHVSKNTISALLRGLEEQGLIWRELDPQDLRAFNIHLTEAGRETIQAAAPKRIQALNDMLGGLTPDELAQLFQLLEKLRLSLQTRTSGCQAESSVQQVAAY